MPFPSFCTLRQLQIKNFNIPIRLLFFCASREWAKNPCWRGRRGWASFKLGKLQTKNERRIRRDISTTDTIKVYTKKGSSVADGNKRHLYDGFLRASQMSLWGLGRWDSVTYEFSQFYGRKWVIINQNRTTLKSFCDSIFDKFRGFFCSACCVLQ